MPLVPAKCPSCGGDIQVDNSRKEAFCSYCGTKFLVESAVNYYNTKNEYHIEHADIKMEDSSGLEAKLRNAESYLVQHKNYEKAEELFKAITEEFAGDWRGWWGVARAMTREFTGLSSLGYTPPVGTPEEVKASIASSFEAFPEVRQYYEGAVKTADPANGQKCRAVWEDFAQRYQKFLDKCFADIYDQSVCDKYADIRKQIDSLSEKASQLLESSKSWRKAGRVPGLGMITHPFYESARKREWDAIAKANKLREQLPRFSQKITAGFHTF